MAHPNAHQQPPAPQQQPLLCARFISRDGQFLDTTAEGGVFANCRLGSHSSLTLLPSSPPYRLIIHVNAPPNLDFKYDVLLRLQRRTPLAESDTGMQLQDARRFTFTNAEDTDINVAGIETCLYVTSTVQAQLSHGVQTYFLIELDYVSQTEVFLPDYTTESPVMNTRLWVKSNDDTKDVCLWVNAALLALYSAFVRRQLDVVSTSQQLHFPDVRHSDCVTFLHQVFCPHKRLSWSSAFSLLATSERLEVPSVWNRCAAFIVADVRHSLAAKLLGVVAAVQDRRARWRLVGELIARADVAQLRRMFHDGFNAYAAFQTPEDARQVTRLLERKAAGVLNSRPNVFALKPRQFASVNDPHSVAVKVLGSDTILHVNEGVLKVYHKKRIQSVTVEDQEILEMCLRFVYPERQQPPLNRLSALLRLARNHQLSWFTAILETLVVDDVTAACASFGATPPSCEATWTLMELAGEYRLASLRTALLYAVQCVDDGFWHRLTDLADGGAYGQLVRRFPGLDADLRQARYFGWVVHDRRRLGVPHGVGPERGDVESEQVQQTSSESLKTVAPSTMNGVESEAFLCRESTYVTA